MKATGFWNASWGTYPSFHACPRPENCQATSGNNASTNTSCLFNSDGPLCAVCLPNHFIEGGVCKSCEASQQLQQSQLIALLAIFFCLVVIFQIIKKRARKLYKKFGRDIVRILTINLGFAQINSTVTSIIDIQWPTSYMQYVKSWDFVNFDVTSLLNLSCAGDGWDYRSRVALASAVPFGVIALFALNHFFQKTKAMSRLKKLSKTRLTVISGNIFDYMDKDGTGTVDEEEFAGMLKLINKDDGDEIFSATNKTSMRNLGATLLADASSMEL